MTEVGGLALLLGIALVLTVVLLSAIVARGAVSPARHTAGYALGRGLPTDPGELALTFEEWVVERPGGVRLPVWEIAGRRSKGLSALFVHDWGASRLDVLAGIEPWPELTRGLLLFDRRGHGDAEGAGRLGRGEADDLQALLDQLGAGPVVLVGLGQGAAIATALAASGNLPASVRGLVVAGPFASFRARLTEQLTEARVPGFLGALALAGLRLIGIRPCDLDEADAARIDVPLLILPCLRDEVAPARALAAAPQATQAGPDEAGDALRTFISRL